MFHQITIVGYLGRDPELRYTPSGQAVTNFNVATSRKYNRADGTQVDETIWFRVSVWGKQAEPCNQYLAKGRPVLVIGRLQAGENGSPRIFTRQDGSAGASFEVTAQTVRFLGGGQSKGEAEAVEGEGESEIPAPAVVEEEIPF